VESSPFRFEGPVDPQDLIGRGKERTELLAHARAGRTVSLAAPRRYGKTSLLRAVGQQLSLDGTVVARVDLMGLDGPADFATRFATAWRRATEDDRKLRRAVQAALAGLASLGVSIAGVGVQVTLREREDSAAVLQTVLDLPRQAERPVLVVLDEFQALHEAWPQGEGVLRGHVQEQLGQVAYVFAGSQPHLLDAAFRDSGRAFYNQVLRVPLGRLDTADLARGLAARFEQTDRDPGAALSPLLHLADGHPQRAMFLAHLLWESLPAGAVADDASWEAALRRARSWTEDEMTAVWSSLSRPQRSALRLVVAHGSATLRTTGTPDVPRSALQAAQEWLLREGIIEVSPAVGPRGGRRFRTVDPLLADAVTRRSG
jgi:hypothetical protein